MGILSVKVGQAGLAGTTPDWVYINTSNTLSEVTATGYLNQAVDQGYYISEKQCVLVATTDYGAVPLQVSISGDVYSLVLTGGGSGGVVAVNGTSGQISSTGGIAPAIGLVNTAVTPGSYTSANITVDSFGRIVSAANGTAGSAVTSVSGSINRITSSGGTTPIIDIASNYAGQASITTVGALSSGSIVAGFTPISPAAGGTGINNGSKTITLTGSIITTGGNFLTTLTLTGNTNLTLPTIGTLATTDNTVASVTAGTGISITGTATNPVINLTDTAVVPGSYTNASITVNQRGRITAASSGATPVTSVSGTVNQIDSSGGATPVLTLSNTVVFPGTVTLDADPVSPLQAATKQYVDLLTAGLNFQAACYAASTADLGATYNNGAVGIGATLTNAGAQAAFATDGTTPSLNARILVKNQTNQAENGIYTLTTIGSGATNWVLTRATDYDTIVEINAGDFLLVTNGTLFANTAWIENNAVTSIGTSPIVFNQFGPVVAGVTSVSGSTGKITSTGGTTPVIDIDAGYVGQPSINTVGALSTGSLTTGFTPVTVDLGGTGKTSFTAYSVVCGGTTGTGALQNVTGLGTAGQVLTSAGAGAKPSWQDAATGIVISITGGTGITVDSTTPAVPIVSIDPTYSGQSSIKTLGTVTAGTWHANIITGQYGGTGVNNSGKTITLGGNLVTSGTFDSTFTMTGTTTVTFPTTGTLLTSADLTNYATLNTSNSFAFNEQYQMKMKDYSETVNALGSIGGGTMTINLTLGNVVSATAAANITTVTLSNVPASGTCSSFSLIATNFGAFTITWPASFKWPTGAAPTLTAAGVDILVFFTIDGGTTWYANVAGQAYA